MRRVAILTNTYWLVFFGNAACSGDDFTLLLSIHQLLQHCLYDWHHHGCGGGVGKPHGEHCGAAHKAKEQPGAQGNTRSQEWQKKEGRICKLSNSERKDGCEKCPKPR